MYDQVIKLTSKLSCMKSFLHHQKAALINLCYLSYSYDIII